MARFAGVGGGCTLLARAVRWVGGLLCCLFRIDLDGGWTAGAGASSTRVRFGAEGTLASGLARFGVLGAWAIWSRANAAAAAATERVWRTPTRTAFDFGCTVKFAATNSGVGGAVPSGSGLPMELKMHIGWDGTLS
ncbi:hypothetical protein FB451DRAFT_1231285 [Mycena latifolia]|nr:hypothetical protein FB451DRAFT_1231285 [Mycena latifolia]